MLNKNYGILIKNECVPQHCSTYCCNTELLLLNLLPQTESEIYQYLEIQLDLEEKKTIAYYTVHFPIT